MNIDHHQFKAFVLQIVFVCAIFACFMSIVYLTIDYLKYDVNENITPNNEHTTKPPSISFCFAIRDTIDFMQIIKIKPKISELIHELRSKDSRLANLTFAEMVFSSWEIRNYIYHNMTLKEMKQSVYPFNKMIAKCFYYSQQLERINCSDQYFASFAYSNDFCYSFKWTSSGMKSDYPNYFNDHINVYGFDPITILELHLNLTQLPGLGVVNIFAHDLTKIHLLNEAYMISLQLKSNQLTTYKLTYSHEIRIKLASPYKSMCKTINDLPNDYANVDDCLYHCTVLPFINLTGKYPRFAAIKQFNEHKVAHDLIDQSSNLSVFIRKLYAKCIAICGNQDCLQENYQIIHMDTVRTLNITQKYVIIKLLPPTKSGYLYYETAKISANQFIASIGSVLGIWFGFSLLSMRNVLLQKMSIKLAQLRSEKNQIFKVRKKNYLYYHHNHHHLMRKDKMMISQLSHLYSLSYSLQCSKLTNYQAN